VELEEKLSILASSAKYDASCASSGSGSYTKKNTLLGENPGRKKKSFNIITTIKSAGKFHQFIYGKGSSFGVSRAAIYTVSAVETADIGKKYL